MAVKNTDTDIIRELFANLKPYIERFTPTQKRLLQVLIEHPNGLSSRELTRLTGILNKSDVLDPKLRLFLAIEHIGLDIKRINKQWHWKLVPMQSLVEVPR
jgi:hypothetical protein